MESDSKMNLDLVSSALKNLSDEIGNESQYKTLINDFLTTCSGKLVDWVNCTIAFSGFDAVIMRKKILSKSSPRKIMICILVGLVRGNNVERISKTMKSPELAKDFLAIVKALNIKKNVGGDYSAITLSRMIACFPETVCMILNGQEIPMAIPMNELTRIHAEYPKVARHQVCASILPHTLSESDLNKAFDVILVPFLKISEVINGKVKDWSKMTPTARAETSSMYLHNSYNSKVLTLTDREELSKKFNIMTTSKTLSAAWSSVSKNASEWLRENYKFSHDN
ncbi:putative nucleoprotein [Hubei lepidoptera virus 1]|uniref:Nucleoprotein n=1 Tax=Hubei lepidoptera virus 1 TaxID=1922903 RepID=A0A1L3KPG0_9VIRU|nr:putative nucleoprotein [Hubei lepidoptera virus 1]APG79263.1 putative nucleoprotein [Hubei lepidoptera virus 1]